MNKKRWLVLILLVVLALMIFVAYRINRHHLAPVAKAPVVTHSADAPEEAKPAKTFQWQGAPNDPKYIRLPTIQAEGFMQNVGVDQHGQLAAPSNVHFAGWFTSSHRPGQPGLSIIDGHVDGLTAAGIFKHLANLQTGAEYTIEMGDGSINRYRVRQVAALDINDVANILFSQDPTIKSQLNLITCGGTFNQQAHQYEKRIVVTSQLLE